MKNDLSFIRQVFIGCLLGATVLGLGVKKEQMFLSSRCF